MVGQPSGGLIAVAGAQLAPGAVAIGVDRGLGHAQLTGDLFGAEVPIDQPQALAFARRQTFDKIHHHPCASRKS